MPNKEIYSARVDTGRRTYFFDIKQSESGERYLLITESHLDDGNFRRHRVLIDEQDLPDFQRGFAEAIAFFLTNRQKW